jgi:hypothetical protein
MKTAIAMSSMLPRGGVSTAQVVNFDREETGAPPAGWSRGVTGSGNRTP